VPKPSTRQIHRSIVNHAVLLDLHKESWLAGEWLKLYHQIALNLMAYIPEKTFSRLVASAVEKVKSERPAAA
jgi:hypothetical protein